MIDDETHEPTPDELLLELLDLVTLAFPEPLANARITFVPSPDGARPCLTDLGGDAPLGGAKRPDLGHDDNETLDAINGLLGELADATERKAGLRVVGGRLEVKAGPGDGSSEVALIEDDGEESVVRMRRRFDRSELSWLFFTAPLFARLASTEEEERRAKQALDDELRAYARFEIDMAQGKITFSEAKVDLVAAAEGAPPVGARSFSFELVGSYLEGSRRFLWGWANESVHPRLVRSVEGLRRASTELGLRALSDADFGCPEKMAERLARHAAALAGARGLYRAPFRSRQGAGFMYLALRDPS